MMRELARAAHDRRELLIYVGATWCEPCRYFHEAAARGDLDQTFPTLRLVELDRDRDEHQLEQTSCLSPMIPMFAKPTPRGNCSDKMIHGSIKGPGAVDEITPRLRRLLEAK
jgi:thiol-disulfide isomerase/thioredoxin